jgi:catechol 2,3-dioxygenase-like lactoylglutathione lyase family enzyme
MNIYVAANLNLMYKLDCVVVTLIVTERGINLKRGAMTYGVIGVTVWTQDDDSLLVMEEFYRDQLGMDVNSRHGGWVSFRFGAIRFNIGVHHLISNPPRDPYRVMVNFGTDNIVELFDRLERWGVTVIRSPEKEHWGGWVATFLDPDGNMVQLIQLVK